MRIEASQPSIVIAPTAVVSGRPAHSFGALLHQSTFLHAAEAQTLLANAWASVVGSVPGQKTSALLTAHWALETDAGRSMPGHNFAGIKATSAAPGAVFQTVEGFGSTRREVAARFRVYDSAEAGAHDYVRLLKARYPAALEAARVGDTAAFAHALAQGGYFSADPKAYAQGLAQRLNTLQGGSPASDPSVLSPPSRVLADAALRGVLHAFRDSGEDT